MKVYVVAKVYNIVNIFGDDLVLFEILNVFKDMAKAIIWLEIHNKDPEYEYIISIYEIEE